MPLRPRRLGATALSAACLVLVSASAADAATMTRSFESTGSARAFDVPAGITAIDVIAIGGRGGDSSGPVSGGSGARVTATLPVTPGQRLWIAVGGNGGGNCADGAFNGGAPGGSSWCGNRGGAGGGASDVRVCAPGAECPDLDPDADPLGRLLVAGGGGGAGRWANDMAGAGGDAGAAGGTMNSVRGTAGGGGAGTATEGGGPGVNGDDPSPPWGPTPAGSGALGAGGIGGTGNAGANTGGGGGGGGLYGGGGGGSANYYAGGGGGGSNLVPVGGSATIDTTGSPSVTLSWEVGDPATIDRPTVARPTIYADGAATTTVTAIVRDDDGAPVADADVSFSATAPQPAIGPVTDNGDGSYSAPVTAAGSRGATQITARLASPDRTSEPVTLTQIDRPTVTSPDNATPVIGRAGQSARVSVSGTADPLTPSVDVRCVTAQGVPQLGGADAVPVVDGRWSVTDATLPSVDDHGPQCRLVAVADGQTETRASAPSGPRLRRLEISEWKPRGSTVAAWVTAGGLDGEARLNTFGSGCGVSLEQVRPDLTTSVFWLSCGAGLGSYSETIDGDPVLLIDGKRAYTAALLEDLSGAAGELPPVTIDATTTGDGSFLVTERSPTRRCTQTDAWPTGADCGALADTGVTVVVRSRIAPSGATVSRRIDFESTDERAHEVRVTLESSTYYLLSPEVRVGDESDWRTPQYGERSSDLGPAHSVLFRRGGTNTVPATAITAVPGPTTQILDRLTLIQRYLRSVPADGAAGVAMTFDMVPRDDAEAAAAAARQGHDVAVAIDAPANGTTTEAESVTLTGTASDQSGPTQLRVAGRRVSVGGDGRWTATVPLNLGENEIEAVVESRYGPRETASLTVTRTVPARPEDPDPPTTPADPPTPGDPTPTDPTPPGGPTPPSGATPPSTTRLLRTVTAPKRARLTRIRQHGLAIPVSLNSPRTRISAELRGPWGAFARTTRTQAKSGRTTVWVKPSRRTIARATAALRRSKTVRLRLKLTVRGADGATQTVTRTIQLRR